MSWFWKKLTKRQKILISCSLSIMLSLTMVSALVLMSMPPTKMAVLEKKEFAPPVLIADQITSDYYGMLVLGSDKGATKTNGGNHTDSITYVAVNKQTNKAITLPIYRDTLIKLSCADKSVNINQVYRDFGADCLKQSFADMSGLRVDYFTYITSNGYVDLLNLIGPITITPEASFCSKFGNDETNYCFTDGLEKQMTGNELLAYARFRGNTSGEARANRHMQLLKEIYKTCTDKKIECSTKVLQQVITGDVATDMPIQEAFELKQITDIEALTVVKGSNFQDAEGWHQQIDASDLKNKADKIKMDIYA
ncbi:MAG: LCP family protein [Culicoidibacterales bacterium]